MSPVEGIETETTLLVLSSHPRELFEELASRSMVAGHRLVSRGWRRLEDLYLDTPGRELLAREVAFRLRRVEGRPPRTLLTVKGPARVHADGRMERRELELPWSAGALEEALAALKGLGAGLPRGEPSAFREDARSSLAPLGLEIVQERANERRVFDLGDEAGETAEPGAELDLDAVTFRLSSRRVRHFEIEIEARGGAGSLVVGAVSRALLEERPKELRIWPHSKTATGEALARLAEEGFLASLLDPSQRPTPEGYEELARLLER